MIRPKVLFLCSGNSCRTQMAEAFLRDVAGERFEAVSAGNHATPLDWEAVKAMRELGIDISAQESKTVDAFLGRKFTFLVSLCDREKEPTCPIFPGAIWRLQWDIENPSLVESPHERRRVVRWVRDEIRDRVLEFVRKH